MLITEIQNDVNLQAQALPRSPGLHVSEVIREVATTMGYLKRDDQEELDWTLARYRLAHGYDIVQMFPTAIYRVAMGLAWEEWLGHQHPEIHFHNIGELERDGIIGTPDGLHFDLSGDGILDEIKLTWKSSRSDRETPQERIGKEFMWLSQTKSYCWQANRITPVRRANLHVFWVNGNYRGSGPEYRVYQLDFEERELEANWRMLNVVGQRMLQEREKDAARID